MTDRVLASRARGDGAGGFDGIFMPTALPTATGHDMQAAYLQIFDAIHLAVTFTIDELEIIGTDTA